MSIRLKKREVQSEKPCRETVQYLMREMDIPCFLAQILVSRGISDAASAEKFLNPSLDDDWLDPYAISGMDITIDMLETAIKNHERIVVFGDFDLDGISATAVMTRGIRALGGKVVPFIPKRFEEGYGITELAITRLMELDPELVITVDCGISCDNEINRLIDAGIKVIITDHHEAQESTTPLPNIPIVDPKAEPDNPSAILAGVGVSLKVICALGSRFGYPYLWRSYTDLATLGTVADLMPMLGENRALVMDGIFKINSEPRPCIAALTETCGMQDKEIVSTNLGFTLAPRLNAAGRMGDAEAALNLLMSDDAHDCKKYAEQLEDLNNKRREIEAALSAEAHEYAANIYAGERVLVVAGKDWHEGVKGIVAARLVGKYKVPTLLFTIEGEEARGSGRSVGNIDLFKAVESCADILTRFGGHSAAVGVTLPVEKLDEFKQRLDAFMLSMPKDQFDQMVEYDAVVSLGEMTIENINQMEKLSPFGQLNPEPVLLAKNVMLSDCRAVGTSKNHLSCALTDGKDKVSAIQFHCANIDELSSYDGLVDVIFTAQVDEWRGRKTVKAMIQQIIPSKNCTALEGCIDSEDVHFMTQLFNEKIDEQHSQDLSFECTENKSRWIRIANEAPSDLQRAVIEAIIGDNSPHKAQKDMLSLLDAGKSVLGIMATGRGKSLIFQAHAAMLALKNQTASVFIYPLRALMADQAYHLATQFERFGLKCCPLNGETPEDVREQTYAGLAAGEVDIVLTTPEFLSFYAERIGECGRIGFVVIDEAHHIGQARAGARPAYRNLGKIISKLGNPVVLALTATANDHIAEEIVQTLPITERIIDVSSRDNLHIDDQRGIAGRDDYLAHIVMSGGKSIIYVNSRDMSVAVARNLRRRLSQIAPMICFYNAGLNREERARIEKLFREGKIQVLVATSAFGEGIDIPDVRHVVLYHMPFSDVEFNQMSGRAGRDGYESWVHLLYGRQDVNMNRKILNAQTPPRDDLAYVYRRLKDLSSAADKINSSLIFKDCELSEKFKDARFNLTNQAILCALSIFSELGLIRLANKYADGLNISEVQIVENADKVELTDSIRYCEGVDEIEDFNEFRDWAMRCDVHGLTVRITHPITPNIDSEVENGN